MMTEAPAKAGALSLTEGSIRLRFRAAVAGYMLLCFRVDCSPDRRLKEERHRRASSDSRALHGV